MERIDPQQFLQKTIPAACEQHIVQSIAQVRPDTSIEAGHAAPHEGGAPASHWLSSAMAIWLQDEDGQTRGTC